MTLNPVWRTRLFAAAASAVGVWLSVEVAQGRYGWAAAVAMLLALFLLARLQPIPLLTILLGAGTFGYVVGNRGFAQVMLLPNFPLLPAEAMLLVGGAVLLVQAAWRHELPIRRDPLNLALLGWILLGAARIIFDVRTFGAMALRDFALVYYAAFFFLAQDMARDPRSRRLFLGALSVGCAVVLPLFWLAEQYPGFFLQTLTFRGSPLIHYKGDLAATLIGAGSVLFFLRFEKTRRVWLVVASLVLAGAVLLMNSRAAMLALAIAAGWLAVRGRWRFIATLALGSLVAAVAILGAASMRGVSWEKTPVFEAYERVLSIADPWGQRTYRGADTFYKGDNNLYRSVWWTAVIDETFEHNPYFGVGFGYDLAERFVREYYADNPEEFSVRSPHNVLVSIFARMGAAGLGLFLIVIAIVAVRTWHGCRVGTDEAALWAVAWALFVSACLGVVLEGPMGAVVFWTTLGVAHAWTNDSLKTRDEEHALADVPAPAAASIPAATAEP